MGIYIQAVIFVLVFLESLFLKSDIGLGLSLSLLLIGDNKNIKEFFSDELDAENTNSLDDKQVPPVLTKTEFYQIISGSEEFGNEYLKFISFLSDIAVLNTYFSNRLLSLARKQFEENGFILYDDILAEHLENNSYYQYNFHDYMIIFDAIFPSCSDYPRLIDILLTKHKGWIYSFPLYKALLSKTKDIDYIASKIQSTNVFSMLYPGF